MSEFSIATETGTRTPTTHFDVRYPATSYRTSRASKSPVKSRRDWIRPYRAMLRVADTLVICAALVVAQLARFGTGRVQVPVADTAIGYDFLGLAIALMWLGALSAFRSRDPRVLGLGSDEYKRVIHSTLLVFGITAILLVVAQVDASRGYFALALPLGMGGLVLTRWMLRSWLTQQRTKGRFLSRVVVLGRPKDVKYVIKQIRSKTGAGYEVVGAALAGHCTQPRLYVDGAAVPVVSDLNSVVEVLPGLGVDAVIVAGPVQGGSGFIQKLGWSLEESDTELVLATGLTNVAGPRIHARPVEGLPLMHVELPQFGGAKHLVKRLLDIAASALALVALLPVFAVIALCIRRDSPGPVLFKQERIGRSGETFTMYKFRSMVVTAEEELAGLLGSNEGSGLLFKMRNDPRVTKVGGWLRRHSLDELPQIWNVLVGDMSLVGPRPPLGREVDGYAKDVHRRLYIKPGLTGMWQINGRSELSWQDSVRLDLYYVENWSITMDLMIIWRTAKMLIKPVGAY
ncbi:sugar transferase [Arthrobacter sp. Sr33]|uniref:sugar transferase n=1 Tax=Arthrobacter sp. TB 23 TaxID=494419 RepID=UPI0002FA4BA5|nr:sugar transferase [Arthrobacter sp. TB 23]